MNAPPKNDRAAPSPKKAAPTSNYGKPSGTGTGTQPENEMGAHAVLQPRAENNAKILLGLWMDHGRLPALDFPALDFPTEPLQRLAENVTDALARGRRGWTEIFEDTADNAVIECDEALRDHETRHGKTNAAEIRKHLGDFHQVKARQFLTWRLQAALDRGEDSAPIIAELAALDAEAVDSGNLLARAYASAFDPESVPPPDENCMVIGNIPVAARGNLTALQGKSKVGKSAVVSAILGAAQRGDFQGSGDTLCFAWQGKADGAIIHLDTEQSRADWHALVRRSVGRSGMPAVSERLVSLPLVMFARSERLAILEGALARETDKRGGIDAVLIDGIADLCASPNDERESLELVSQVHALAQKFNCPIYCVLHENPSTQEAKTRGHLGSELNRKAFANLRIDKDAETLVSTIYGTDMRKRDLPREQGFCFAWDEAAGMHVFKGRSAGLKAAEKEAKAIAAAREIWEPIFEIGSQRENSAVPALSSKDAAEIEREISGNEKMTKPDTMKKRMQKAESLGVLRKFDALTWTLAKAGKPGNEREN